MKGTFMNRSFNFKKGLLMILSGLLMIGTVSFSPVNQITWSTQTPLIPEGDSSVIKLRNPAVSSRAIITLKNQVTTSANPEIQIVNPTSVTVKTATPMPVIAPVTWDPSSNPGRSVEVIPTGENVPRPAYDCNVQINSPYWFAQYAPGEDFDFDVTITNTGTAEWGTDIDVMQYTGWLMEIEGKYLYDIDKDYDSAYIVQPGQSIRWKIRMEAPKEKTTEDDKYYTSYNLVRAHDVKNGMFCPFSLYIYVPHN